MSQQFRTFEDLEFDRARYIYQAYVTGGLPISQEHAKYIEQRSGVGGQFGYGDVDGSRRVEEIEATPPRQQKLLCDSQGSPNTSPGQSDLSRERWVQVNNPESGELHAVRVLVDTQASVNWILPRIVRDFNLKRVKMASPKTFKDFQGNPFHCDCYADVSWTGPKKSRRTRFYVGPERGPFELLVCDEFFKEHGVEALFADNPDKFSLPVVESEMTEQERAERERQAAAAKKAIAALAQNRAAKNANKTRRDPK